MPSSPSKLSRRTLFAGVGTVGAMATVSGLLPLAKSNALSSPDQPRVMPTKGGGYSLSDHVKQYYRTTHI